MSCTADPVNLSVPVRSAPDRQLDLSDTGYAMIGSFFLLILPDLFLWWHRRRK